MRVQGCGSPPRTAPEIVLWNDFLLMQHGEKNGEIERRTNLREEKNEVDVRLREVEVEMERSPDGNFLALAYCGLQGRF